MICSMKHRAWIASHFVFASCIAVSSSAHGLPSWLTSWVTGIEAGHQAGVAWVESSTTDRAGGDRRLADGQAKSGIRYISMPSRPDGWYISVGPRVSSINIAIEDFATSVPMVSTAESEIVPYVETEYETGLAVDGRDTNHYEMQIASLALVGGAGYHQKFSCEKGRCWTVGAGLTVHLVDYLRNEVTIGTRESSKTQVSYLWAYGGQCSFGYLFADEELAFVLAYSQRQYPKFPLPDSLEFRDKITFNEAKQAFERRRVLVDEVSMRVGDLSLSLAYFF